MIVRTTPVRSHPTRVAVCALAVLVPLLAAQPSAATQIVVTTTSDELNTDGDCSLREAFRAANFNAPRDACPAGSATGKDEIVLASDAVYSLTIPFSGAPTDDGQTGELVVLNNASASIDLEITVAGDGMATISQDAVPDTRVLTTGVATVLIEDVVIEGGTLTGTSNRGAGIFVGGALTLTRCVVRENRAADSGGGIRNQGKLVIQDSVLDDNSTAASGGAISNSSNSSLIVDGTQFSNNSAASQFGGGGAIESSEQISITDSTFVNNLARGIGGAISHFHNVPNEASISQSCFVGNQAGFSGNAVDTFSGSEVLAAAGNWWGADNGPSGEGPGSGDGVDELVDFDPHEPEPHPGCLPLEMVANGGFQADFVGDGIPERWTASSLGPNDGRVCNDGGACNVKIRGNGPLKRLAHTVPHSGAAGDTFEFKARSRAQNVPTTPGAYRAVLTISHTDGSKQTVFLDFSTGKHGFERKTKQVVASKPYSQLQVAVEYGKVGGVVRFDSVSLVLGVDP